MQSKKNYIIYNYESLLKSMYIHMYYKQIKGTI